MSKKIHTTPATTASVARGAGVLVLGTGLALMGLAATAPANAAPKHGTCTIVANPDLGRHTSCPGAKLAGEDLRDHKLGMADLSGADLSGADLRGVNLGWANLKGANLSRAKLSSAYLVLANLENANLTNADLRYADVTRANFTGAKVTGAAGLIPGPQGLEGKQGRPGLDGEDGEDGMDGAKGGKGDPGPPGRDGFLGCTLHYHYDRPYYEGNFTYYYQDCAEFHVPPNIG